MGPFKTPDSPQSAPEVRRNSELEEDAACEQAFKSERSRVDSLSLSGDFITTVMLDFESV